MRKIITLSAVAALATCAFASDADLAKRVAKLEKTLKKTQEQLSEVKAHDGGDNIKFDVDFRTANDTLMVETASGKEFRNDSLLSNRLWLGMGYALNENMVFKGQLSYNKAYGAAPSNPTNGYPQRGFGYDTFDWVINENLTDGTIKLREAYWLYMNSSLFDSGMSFTASLGRRPSTNGFLANLREDDSAKSPLGHVINLEFDGASFKFGLDKLTGVPGMYWKLCLGRGLSNARARFNMDGGLASYGDYTVQNGENNTPKTLDTVDMAGFIFVPYDDGQYRVETTWYRGFNVPGFDMATGNVTPNATGGFDVEGGMLGSLNPVWNPTTGQFMGVQAGGMGSNFGMETMGDQDGAAISLMIDGIGDGWADFLDDTVVFGSYAISQTHPNNERQVIDVNAFNGFQGATAWEIAGAMNQMMAQNPQWQNLSTNMMDYMDPTGPAAQALGQAMAGAATMSTTGSGMLGSTETKTGHSYWVGIQMPALVTEDGRIGLEYNHGSKYWRPFTYGEDTMVASKTAARGYAYEAYWTQPLMGKAFTMQVRYTYIDYKHTGSQAFFGADGTPMTIADAQMMGMDPVDNASDLRVYFRYRY